MSARQTKAERAQSVWCPVCDALPGRRCNAAKGGGVEMETWTHAERRRRVAARPKPDKFDPRDVAALGGDPSS